MMPPSQYTPKDVYACDGTTFEFAVTFPVDKPADVVVFLTVEATGVTRRMVRNQDYTIREEAGVLTVVTRVDELRDPWPAGYTLTILRRMSFAQPSGRAGMSPKVFANRVDSLTRIFQQLREKLDRTLHVGVYYPPLIVTSRPYPLLSDDSIQMGVATPRNSNWGITNFEAVSFAFGPTAGSLQLNLVEYDNYPMEEIDIGPFTPTAGELDLALLEYENYPMEEIDIGPFIPEAGELFAALVEYDNYPMEEIDVGPFAPTGGSLT